jgi:hypothetical protein
MTWRAAAGEHALAFFKKAPRAAPKGLASLVPLKRHHNLRDFAPERGELSTNVGEFPLSGGSGRLPAWDQLRWSPPAGGPL